MLTYSVDEEWPESSSRFVVDGLAAFNAAHSTVTSERKVAVTALDDDRSVVGGLLGRTDHGWFYVGWLWVSEGLRGHGLGTQLMERAEAAAHERGCHHAHLTTLEFQARAFYERRGYRVFGTLDDYPRPYQRFFMQKELMPKLPRDASEEGGGLTLR